MKALGLVDATPFPFSPAGWNSHTLKNYNNYSTNVRLDDVIARSRKFAIAFTTRIFKQMPSDADMD